MSAPSRLPWPEPHRGKQGRACEEEQCTGLAEVAPPVQPETPPAEDRLEAYLALSGRLSRSGRRRRLRLPRDWPWAMGFLGALERLRAVALRT